MTQYNRDPGRTLDLAGKDAIANRWRTLSIRILALLLVTLMCSGGMSAYSVLTHEEIVDLLLDGPDQAAHPQALSWALRRTDQGRSCLRLWWGGHPGPRLLSIRQRRIQQPGALRSYRGFRSRTAGAEQ